MFKFLFLGTGSSTGVPVIGCKCPVCSSYLPSNKRLRPSGLLKIGGQVILIDPGPDFRQQALKYGIDHLDGCLLTHTHFDHVGGIDELRVYYLRQKQALPFLLSEESFQDLKIRYYYFFQPQEKTESLAAQLDFHLLPKDVGTIDFLGIKISYFTYFQGKMKIMGFRIGTWAYGTDIRRFDKTIFESLSGIKTLVLSAPRETSSSLQFSLEEAIAFCREIEPDQTWLTHIAHQIDHERTAQKLPPGIGLAWDGLEIEIGL